MATENKSPSSSRLLSKARIAQILHEGHAHLLLQESHVVADQMLSIEDQFFQIHKELVAIDALPFAGVVFEGDVRPKFTDLFSPLREQFRNSAGAARAAAVNGREYCNTYMNTVIPIVRRPDVSQKEKIENIQYFIEQKVNTPRQAQAFVDGFNTLKRDLFELGDKLQRFSQNVGERLTLEIEETKKEIDRLKEELEKFRQKVEIAFHLPSKGEDIGLPGSDLTNLLDKASSSKDKGADKGAGMLVAAVPGTAAVTSAAGSVGAATVIAVVAPLACVAYIGVGIYLGTQFARAIDGLNGYARTAGHIATKRLLLTQLIKDGDAVAASVKTLFASADDQLMAVANRLNPIIDVSDFIRDDARALVELLSDMTREVTIAEIQETMDIATAWYTPLYAILHIISGKAKPMEPIKPGPIDKSHVLFSDKFAEYLAEHGNAKPLELPQPENKK